jgi:tetratricopeptide (TPR) repeat protein
MSQESIQTLVPRGEKAFRAGKFAEAAELYQELIGLYSQSGDVVKAAEMANNRSVALLQAGQAQAALEAAEGTDKVFSLAGDVRRQALAIGNQAAALEALNRLDDAMNRYLQCNDLLKQVGDPDNRASVLKSISALQIRTGRQLEALASMDAALTNQKKLTLKERFLKKLLDIPMRMVKHS